MTRYEGLPEYTLEYLYRRVEHGIRVMFKCKREGLVQEDTFDHMSTEMIAQLRAIRKELGHKPRSPRWPL